MQWQQFGIIFFVCLAVFAPYFFRPSFFGYDSYYYLGIVCNGTQPIENEPFLSKLLFEALPCNFLFLKLLLFSCCLFSAFGAALLGNKMAKNGWLAGVFVFASLVWAIQFFGLEAEPFAFAIIFWAACIFYYGNSWWAKLGASALVLVATQLWVGSWLMLIAFALSWPLVLLPTGIPLLYFFRGKIISYAGTALPNLLAQESWPGLGLLYQSVLFPAMLALKKVPTIFAPTTFFILLAFVNMRFACFAAFFLAVLAASQAGNSRFWLALFGFGTCLGVMFIVLSSQNLPPNQNELDAVQLAVKEAHGTTICNQWGLGHLIAFYGGIPSDRAGGQQQCVSCVNCVMLTYENQPDCLQLNEGMGETEIKVFKC